MTSLNNLSRVDTVATAATVASANTTVLDRPSDGGSLGLAASSVMVYLPDDKQYESLAKCFNLEVLLSTFACSLVVGYTAFADNLARNNTSRINYANGIPYNACMLLALLSIAHQVISVVISGRGAVLCSDPYLVVGERHHTVKEFKIILFRCQRLNLHGFILWAVTVLGYGFFIFDDLIYPVVFCGISLTIVAFIFFGKYARLWPFANI